MNSSRTLSTDINSVIGKDGELNEDEKDKKLPKGIKPPETFDEYLAISHLTEWPLKVPDESLIKNFKPESQHDILAQLKSVTLATDLNPLQELSERLRKFKEKLCRHADLFLLQCDSDEVEPTDPCSKESPLDKDVSYQPNGELQLDEKEMLYIALKQSSIDSCKFPGFDEKRLTNLPGSQEPAPVLETVTVAQSFMPRFLKFWNKIFQSEASVAVLLDAFWWTFIDKFQPELREAQSHLFDRIADSFVALVNSIHLELKDKFLVIYADCLAQAIFVAYWQSFPGSLHRFDEAFKEYLISITHEWVTGGLPPPGRSENWNKKILETNRSSQRPNRVNVSELSSIVHGHYDAALRSGAFKLALSEFKVDLYDEERSRIKTTPEHPKLRLGMQSVGRNLDECRQLRQQGFPAAEATQKERVLFNIKAQSPLVSHYLEMLCLKASELAEARKEILPLTYITK